MKKSFFSKVICFLLIILSKYIDSGAQLVVNRGVHVTSIGKSAHIVLSDIGLENHGIINHSSGRVVFSGTSPKSITGNGTLNFFNLELAKPGRVGLTLQRNIGIKNQLTFTSGLLDLNNRTIDLFSTGSLVNENETSRALASNGGKIRITRNLNAPSNVNPGNLGAILSSAENMGSVVIQRGHQSQINDQAAGNSILRYYDIDPANNFNLKATLRFLYFNAELDGINEADLVLFKGTANGSWVEKGFTTRDAGLNYVEKINNPDFSRWTLSNTGNPLASGCPDGLPAQNYYADQDGDGYGDPNNVSAACTQPEGFVTNKTDCNDKNAAIHPGAQEICNGIDDDCDGLIDENVQILYYPDVDRDGYGNSSMAVFSCMPLDNYVTIGGDCDDNNARINPGVPEVCGNFIDDNCNGQIDEACPATIPSIIINDVIVNESQGTAQLTVSLSTPSANSVRVSYRTENGTATHPKDYTRKIGELVFAPGNTTQIITIAIIADNKAEPDEYFDVLLHSPVAATISDNSGRVTITESLVTKAIKVSEIRETGNKDHFDVKVSNNPTHTQFRLDIESGQEELLTIQVSDVNGRIIQSIQAKQPFQPIYLGTNYRPGVYFAQVIQGNNRKIVKLIKF